MSRFLLNGVILLALTIGGSVVGVTLSHLLVPQSRLALGVGFFMFPGALVAGLSLWWALAEFGEIFLFFKGVVISRSLKKSLVERKKTGRFGGRFVLILASEGVCLASGIIIALLSNQNALAVIGGYAGLGLIYGVIVFLLAGQGVFDEFL